MEVIKSKKSTNRKLEYFRKAVDHLENVYKTKLAETNKKIQKENRIDQKLDYLLQIKDEKVEIFAGNKIFQTSPKVIYSCKFPNELKVKLKKASKPYKLDVNYGCRYFKYIFEIMIRGSDRHIEKDIIIHILEKDNIEIQDLISQIITFFCLNTKSIKDIENNVDYNDHIIHAEHIKLVYKSKMYSLFMVNKESSELKQYEYFEDISGISIPEPFTPAKALLNKSIGTFESEFNNDDNIASMDCKISSTTSSSNHNTINTMLAHSSLLTVTEDNEIANLNTELVDKSEIPTTKTKKKKNKKKKQQSVNANISQTSI